MQLHEFKYQEKWRKQELLRKNGVFLSSRPQGDYQILLYAVDAFYVEVYYDLEHGQTGYIKAFNSLERLEPYLGQISLAAIA